jgi:hypothetical protein
MNKLILATGSDINYLNKMNLYLGSIDRNSNFDKNVLIFVTDDGNVQINNTFQKIEVNKLLIGDIKSLNKNKCVQHGDFLNSKEFFDSTDDNDVIFFTDGDIELQRSLSEDEITNYKNFKDGDVYVGYNASPTDTLQDESTRLGRTRNLSPNIQNFDWDKIKVYNTGVLAMNKKTWKTLLNEYNRLFPDVNQMFHHYAKQQWLISYIIGTNKYFNVIEMSYDIHNHRHYPSPIGTHVDKDRNVYYNDKKVLFKHRW